MTDHERIAKKIHAFFKLEKAAGLVLPDGWSGRPHDNQHRLTYIEARPHKLLIELDEQLLLVFTDLKTVHFEDSMLVLEDFAQLTFDWQEYGSNNQPHSDVYRQGRVAFVPPPNI